MEPSQNMKLKNHSLTGSLSSSSVNTALSSAYFEGPHGPQKLSLSSADSSSSAPNSPPPNYDDVFDKSAVNNFSFLTNNSNSCLSSSSSSNNCFDNKTYFQRPGAQQLSASLSNLRNDQVEQQTTTELAPSPSFALLKQQQKQQFSIFSFVEQNEEIRMSSRKNSTDFLSTSMSMQLSPLLSSEEMSKKMTPRHPFNLVSPPPRIPPPPPPANPPRIPVNPLKSGGQLTPAVSQTSINSLSTPAPPTYPPPPSTHHTLFKASSMPPSVPARPKKNNV
jgi:hypothetical protein